MSHMSSMESLASQISQTQTSCSYQNKGIKAERPMLPTYPSIDSVLKASVPSSRSSSESLWALYTASVSRIGIDETPDFESPSTESLPEGRPISYLAPLPVFPMAKRHRDLTSAGSTTHSDISPSTPATPSRPSHPSSDTDPAPQPATTARLTLADSRKWSNRPPIPERESSLDFQWHQQEQQDRERIYLTFHPSFPARAPAKHPHIIARAKIASAPAQSIGFADVVVTTLHSHSPATLTAFLKLQTFEFWYERGALKRFYIQRRKRFVTVGFEQRAGSCGKKKKQQLDEGFTYRIVAEPQGPWEPLCAMGRMNGVIFGLREMDAYVRKVFVGRMMREMGWIKGGGGSGSKFVEGEM